MIYYLLTFIFLLAPASRNEFQTIRQQLEAEKIPPLKPGDPPRSFHSLMPSDQAILVKKRLSGQQIPGLKLAIITNERI